MIPSRPSYVAAALLLAVLPGCHHDPAPAQQMAGPDPLIARGEYLVRTSGCNDCHTSGYPERQGEVPVEQWLTGSPLGYHGPWGTTYATNLRLRMQELDEPRWLQYSGNLHPAADARFRGAGDERGRPSRHLPFRALVGGGRRAGPAGAAPGRDAAGALLGAGRSVAAPARPDRKLNRETWTGDT